LLGSQNRKLGGCTAGAKVEHEHFLTRRLAPSANARALNFSDTLVAVLPERTHRAVLDLQTMILALGIPTPHYEQICVPALTTSLAIFINHVAKPSTGRAVDELRDTASMGVVAALTVT
jgi:hypothetical protein